MKRFSTAESSHSEGLCPAFTSGRADSFSASTWTKVL